MLFKFAPYSFTKIGTFESCKQKFKFAYIDKVKSKVDFTHLQKGRSIHSLLESYNLDTVNQNLQIVNKFITSEIGKIYQPAIIGSVKSLKEFKIGLDYSLNPCNYFNKSCLFRGICDLVFIKDGELVIADYKTGKYKDQTYQDYRQLLFYSIYFFKYSDKIKQIRIDYVYVEHNLVNSLTLNREYLNNYCDLLLKSINEVESCQDFDCTHKWCNWCEYAGICQTTRL